MSKLTSEIWKYFTINDIDEIKDNCNICNGKLSRGGQNARSYGTLAQIKHLHSAHHFQYDLTPVFIKRKFYYYYLYRDPGPANINPKFGTLIWWKMSIWSFSSGNA